VCNLCCERYVLCIDILKFVWMQNVQIYVNLEIFVQMVAKGKDASDLFPAVVKNVVSKNTEVWNVDSALEIFWLSFVLNFVALIT